MDKQMVTKIGFNLSMRLFPEWTALEEFRNLPNENYPFGRTDDWSDVVKNSTPIQDFLKMVQYPCPPVDLKQLNVLYSEDMLHDVMDCKTPTTNIVPVYYYHPDHLGSTSWVTNFKGNEHQFIAYLPYGEPLLNVLYDNYDSRYGLIKDARYKFTGKERDRETGYDYMEQRYYYPPLSIWLRPDPLLDKYIHLSPYAYCNGNPLKYVDPKGEEKHNMMDPNTDDIEQCYLYEGAMNFHDFKGDTHIFFISHGSPEALYPYGSENPMNAEGFVSYLSENSNLWKNTDDKSSLTIVLVSCETGKGDNPIAQQISKLLPGTKVIAPTEVVRNGTQDGNSTIIGTAETDYLPDIKDPSCWGKWNTYLDGEVIKTSNTGYIGNVYL